MGRLWKMMDGIAHSAAAVWNRLPSFHPRAAWKWMGSSSFNASAAAATWKRSCPASSYYLPPHRPVLCSFTRRGVHGNLSFHRKLSTNSNYNSCKDPLPDSEIKGFIYEDCEPPETINWRKLGMVTPVQDQVIDGACWAFAATAAIESINAIRTGKLVKLSEQQIIDCNNLSNSGYFGGHAHMAFDYVVRNGGLVEDSAYPAAAAKQCPCRKIVSHMVTIDGYQFVPRNDELALMKAVANQPVVVDIRLNAKLLDYKGGIAYDDGMRGELNHSALLVAFDKTRKGEKFWVLKDSFGTKYRKKGCILIGRGTGRAGGEFGITEFPCFPVKISENCEGLVDDDLSLYHKLYGRKSAEKNEDAFDYSSTGDDPSSVWRD